MAKAIVGTALPTSNLPSILCIRWNWFFGAASVSWWFAVTSSPLRSPSMDEPRADANRGLAYCLLLRRYRMNWRHVARPQHGANVGSLFCFCLHDSLQCTKIAPCRHLSSQSIGSGLLINAVGVIDDRKSNKGNKRVCRHPMRSLLYLSQSSVATPPDAPDSQSQLCEMTFVGDVGRSRTSPSVETTGRR